MTVTRQRENRGCGLWCVCIADIIRRGIESLWYGILTQRMTTAMHCKINYINTGPSVLKFPPTPPPSFPPYPFTVLMLRILLCANGRK